MLYIKIIYILYNINNMQYEKVYDKSPELFIKLLMYTRDYKNGLGLKSESFEMLQFLKSKNLTLYKQVIEQIATTVGCYKDLIVMAELSTDEDLVELNIYANHLLKDLDNDQLLYSYAYKWAPRESNKYNKLANKLATIIYPFEKNKMELYRKNILKPLGNKTTIVEKLMCENKWSDIDYKDVPMKAMLLYGRQDIIHWDKNKNQNLIDGAFKRHDATRFTEYINKKTNKNKSSIVKMSIENIINVILNEENMDSIKHILDNYNIELSIQDQSSEWEICE